MGNPLKSKSIAPPLLVATPNINGSFCLNISKGDTKLSVVTISPCNILLIFVDIPDETISVLSEAIIFCLICNKELSKVY